MVACRRRRERLERRARLQNAPDMAVPRLQPITHREGSATLAPAVQARPLTDPITPPSAGIKLLVLKVVDLVMAACPPVDLSLERDWVEGWKTAETFWRFLWLAVLVTSLTAYAVVLASDGIHLSAKGRVIAGKSGWQLKIKESALCGRRLQRQGYGRRCV